MRRLDRGDIYPAVADLADESGWTEDLADEEFADVLRSTLREEYADSSDEEMADALENVLDAMTPAEAFNFGSALNQIGKSASRLASDPAFIQVARTAAPIAGGALGTLIGGPVGTALGSKLGSLAANALPDPTATAETVGPSCTAHGPRPLRTVGPAPGRGCACCRGAGTECCRSALARDPGSARNPRFGGGPAGCGRAYSECCAAASDLPLAPGPASPVAGGSAAAAQGLVLTQQPEVLRSLLAAALGQHGRQQVSGVPVAQLLTLFSQVFGQAAADADELMYLEQQADAAESRP